MTRIWLGKLDTNYVQIMRRMGVATVVAIAVTSLAQPVGAARSMKADDVRDGYREVLGTLASGDEAKALDELFDFEVAVLGKKITPGRVDGYWKLKLGVIRDLVASESLEVLVPITVLHHDAYLMYRDEGRRTLAAHSRVMASELAEFYADRAETVESRRFAAWVLTSFGAYLQDFWALSSSAEYFRRALDQDPANLVALFRLAASLEKRGEYQKAIEQLDMAVRLDPQNDHARLRLALCRIRAEDPFQDLRSAHRDLSIVSAGDGSDWVRSVAFQELTKLEVALENPSGAEAAARRGLELFPADQQLALNLANLLDRERRPGEAEELVESITVAGWNDASARYLYNTWPDAGIEGARAALRGTMSPMLPPLKAGLAGESGEAVGK